MLIPRANPCHSNTHTYSHAPRSHLIQIKWLRVAIDTPPNTCVRSKAHFRDWLDSAGLGSGTCVVETNMDSSLRNQILDLLGQHRIMSLATLRPDGWPQATTVGYAHEGLNIYFLC